jgi:hypothetical protein
MIAHVIDETELVKAAALADTIVSAVGSEHADKLGECQWDFFFYISFFIRFVCIHGMLVRDARKHPREKKKHLFGYNVRRTRKNIDFVWQEEHDQAMESLKQAIIASPALIPIDYKSGRTVFLAIDSSFRGVGWIVSQACEDGQRRPSRFWSIGWNERESRYSSREAPRREPIPGEDDGEDDPEEWVDDCLSLGLWLTPQS